MLNVLTLEQGEQWDRIVRSFEQYDTYWLSGYVKAFMLHGDGVPMLFYYEKDGIRGINVVMKRDIARASFFAGKLPENQYFDFASPYGYGGWLIEGKEAQELFQAYYNWCESQSVVSEFVRFHPIIGNHKACNDFYETVSLGEVVHMDLSSPEIIWDNIISKNKNMIRKAIKNDVRIYNGRYPEIYEIFRQIYNTTMDRDQAKEYYYFEHDFYQSILEDLPQNAQVFYAVKEGQVIAASIILNANGMLNYHLSGSIREFSSLAATNLLLYRVALWGNANGYRTLYLGGGVGSGEDSLFKFKRAFNKGQLKHFYIGKKVFCPIQYNELVQIKGQTEKNYFPEYRA